MVRIRKNSHGYRKWKTRINAKNLKKRTKRKNRSSSHSLGQSSKFHRTAARTSTQAQFPTPKHYSAPQKFSIFENAEPTLSYFGDIVKFLKSRKDKVTHIRINIKAVTSVSIDSIIYLLAIMRNAEHKKSLLIDGNFPDSNLVTQHIVDSGFLKYVNLKITLSQKVSSDCFQITTGTKTEPILAGEVCDYCFQKLSITEKDCKFLHPMLVELMTNTNNHAYKKSGPLVNFKEWYLFVENAKDHLAFVFLDTGSGIPNTVAKKLSEHILNYVKGNTDSDYIYSVLKGEFRSATKKPNRGNGLPDIYNRCTEGYIQNLKIISGNGFFAHNGDNDIVTELNCDALEGTLFYWEVSKSQFRKVI